MGIHVSLRLRESGRARGAHGGRDDAGGKSDNRLESCIRRGDYRVCGNERMRRVHLLNKVASGFQWLAGHVIIDVGTSGAFSFFCDRDELQLSAKMQRQRMC
jgi:hypothetical protein